MIHSMQIMQKVCDFRNKWKAPVERAVRKEYGLEKLADEQTGDLDELQRQAKQLLEKHNYTFTVCSSVLMRLFYCLMNSQQKRTEKAGRYCLDVVPSAVAHYLRATVSSNQFYQNIMERHEKNIRPAELVTIPFISLIYTTVRRFFFSLWGPRLAPE